MILKYDDYSVNDLKPKCARRPFHVASVSKLSYVISFHSQWHRDTGLTLERHAANDIPNKILSAIREKMCDKKYDGMIFIEKLYRRTIWMVSLGRVTWVEEFSYPSISLRCLRLSYFLNPFYYKYCMDRLPAMSSLFCLQNEIQGKICE